MTHMEYTWSNNMTNISGASCHHLIHSTALTTNTDVVVFVVLIFIAFNLMIASCYSIYRENYATDPDYLKITRTVSVATTTLQLICFCGYFSGIFIIQRLASTIWYRLFSLALIGMGLKFAESYILLVSTNYSLQDHNKIPTKYIVTIFLVWLIGSCIDITGTVSGFVYVCYKKVKYRRITVLCFAIWDLTCLIFLVILMYILKRIQRKFREILRRKLEYQKDKQENKKKRPIIKSYSDTKAEESVNDQQYDTNSVNTMNMISLLPSHNSSATYTVKTSMSKTIGSINDSVITQRCFIMRSEVKRMQILICGLYVLFCIFLFNLLFHGYQALADFGLISKVPYIEEMISAEPDAIKVWVIAGVYFPQWTVINVFVMGFSWIPGSQMLPQWTE